LVNKKSAIAAIERLGICLVYPIDNRRAPASLWSHFYPRSKMNWVWDAGGDSRVADMWHLREELSRSGRVVYAKWYTGRATFFSKPIFAELLRRLNFSSPYPKALSHDAANVLAALQENSPLSTKQLKAAVGLQGKLLEGVYTKSLKQLWDRGLIVGHGEIDDGAFPSLAIGSTELLFEDIYRAAANGASKEGARMLDALFERDPLISRFYHRVHRATRDPASL